VIRFGKTRYLHLRAAEQDRSLTARELRFVQRYRGRNPECEIEDSLEEQGLDALRGLAVAEEADVPSFDRRVLRRWRVQSVKQTARYWTPALCGAAVAAIALLAMLQILSAAQGPKPLSTPGTEAQRSDRPTFPDLGGGIDSVRP